MNSTMLGVKIDRQDPTLLHQQVAGEIRRAIADGEAKPGERLPPAKDLAAVLGVNTNTVLRALRELRDEGLLEFRRGRGITVAGTPEQAAVITRAQELVNFARQHGYQSDELDRESSMSSPKTRPSNRPRSEGSRRRTRDAAVGVPPRPPGNGDLHDPSAVEWLREQQALIEEARRRARRRQAGVCSGGAARGSRWHGRLPQLPSRWGWRGKPAVDNESPIGAISNVAEFGVADSARRTTHDSRSVRPRRRFLRLVRTLHACERETASVHPLPRPRRVVRRGDERGLAS